MIEKSSYPSRSRVRGSSAIMIALAGSATLALLGGANALMSELNVRQASRAANEATGREANANTVEMLAGLFDRGLIVAFTLPENPPTVAAPALVPNFHDCKDGKASLSQCKAATHCTNSSACVPDDPSTDGDAIPTDSDAALKQACLETFEPPPDCRGICEATDCKASCEASNPKPKNCEAMCSQSSTKACESACQGGLPKCKLCIPDPDSEEGCQETNGIPKTPPLAQPPRIETTDGPVGEFDQKKGVYITYDHRRLSALPPGASFIHGLLRDARLERRMLHPKYVFSAEQAGKQTLPGGTFVGDATCNAHPQLCLEQKARFGNVIASATPGGDGAVEVELSTRIPGRGVLRGQSVRTRARITVPIRPAPVPTCTLTASPEVVYSHLSYAGNMWTTLTLQTTVVPDFPGLIQSSNLAGMTLPPTGGSRVVPYPYGASEHTYHATVTGPGGTGQCSVTVRSVCLPRSPLCFPRLCYYPLDNFPRCRAWLNCWHGRSCWNRGEVLGCFAPDTKLAVSDKETRKAATLATGNVLWNPVTRQVVRIKSRIVGPEEKALVELGYDDHLIRVSTQHPVVTRRGLLQAAELLPTDEVQGEDMKFHRLRHLRRSNEPATKLAQTVINFEIDTDSEAPEDHFLLADGIVVGDYFLQQQLARRVKAAPPPPARNVATSKK